MKHSSQLIIAIIFCFTFVNCTSAKEKIKGNGNAVKETREAKPFTKIEIDGVFQVFLSQSEKEAIVVESDENLLPYLITNIDHGVLSVRIQDNVDIKKSSKMNIHITIKDIDKLIYRGVGKVTCSTHLNLTKLNLINSGVGSIKLKGKAKEVYIRNSGVGSIQALDFIVENLNVKNSGVGSVKVHATKELSIHSSGIGSISYTGDARVKDISNSGIGSVRKL